MNKDIFIILILIIILFMLNTKKNKEHMGDDNNFKYLNSRVSSLVYNTVYSNDEDIEITNLSTYKKNIIADYGTNINNVINNNISIYQTIIEPLYNTIDIDGNNFNLMEIAWKRSKFTYNNKKVGLELQLIHRNYISIYNLVIIIPLDLISDNINAFNIEQNTEQNLGQNTEQFKNIDYNKMTQLSNQSDTNQYSNIKDSTDIIRYDMELIDLQKRKDDLKNKFNLNSTNKMIINNLLTNELFVPTYKSNNVSIQKFNFCFIKNIISKNETFYNLEDHTNNIYYICEPVKFPENIGLDIREKIIDDVNVKYLKKIE